MTMARSVLIVYADQITIASLTGIVTRSSSWKILEARNLLQAKTATERSEPDVTLISHKMPQIDGVQVTQAILNSVPRSRVLFLYDDNSMVHSAFAAGVLGYVLRSQVDADLMPAIDQLLLGRAFFTAEAIRLLRLREHRNPYPGEHKALSPREVTVLQQIALGFAHKDIASNLQISSRTVEHHRAAIMDKLELKTPSDLVRYAIRTGLIQA